MSVSAAARSPIQAVILDIGGILGLPFADVLFAHLAGRLGMPGPRLLPHRAAEAVFTDDKPERAPGARAAGMRAIHYRDLDGFSKDLARRVAPGA